MKRLGVVANHMLHTCSLDCDVQRPCCKRFEHQTAVTPLAVFAFTSSSREIDVRWTLIHAKMGQHLNKCQNHFHPCLSLSTSIFLAHISISYGRSGIQIEGPYKE